MRRHTFQKIRNVECYCYDSRSDHFKISSKGINKRTLEDPRVGPMAYRQVFNEAVEIKSTNRRFKSSNRLVGAHEQTKKITFTPNGKYLRMA